MKLGKPTCRFCRSWKNIDDSPDSALGTCHHNPPNIYGEHRDYFPVCKSTDSCQQFAEWRHPEVDAMKALSAKQLLLDFRQEWSKGAPSLNHPIHELDRYIS